MAKHKSLAHYKDHVTWWGQKERASGYMEHFAVVWIKAGVKDKKRIDPIEFIDRYYRWQRDSLLKQLREVPHRHWPLKERRMKLQNSLLVLRLLKNRTNRILTDLALES